MAKISPVNIEDRAKLGISPGDTVRVWIKVQEKGKTRLQPFEGLVLAHKHGNEPGATFTVRKVASGVGVEKIFLLYSPNIDKIEIIRRAKVRRAKLYYIREKAAREIRRQMRNMRLVQLATESDIAAKEALQQAQDEAAAKAAEGAGEKGAAEDISEVVDQQDQREEKDLSQPKADEHKAQAGGEVTENKEAEEDKKE